VPRETQDERVKRAARVVRALARAYPNAHCALHYETPFQLLIATILSAQCTDEMVNRVTAELFARYGTPRALAEAEPAEIEHLIRPTGFFRQKAKSLQSAARDIVERFDDRVPSDLAGLVSLRGVARKTANVVLGNAFGIPGLAVDTHMIRVNRRLGLTEHEDPVKIEQGLMTLIPRAEWTMYTHRVIHHGRVCCQARRPRCEACPLRALCPFPDAARAQEAASRRRGAGRGRAEAEPGVRAARSGAERGGRGAPRAKRGSGRRRSRP
jgi:endonuclease III